MHKILHIITRLDRGGSAENTVLTCLGLREKYKIVLVHGLSLESRMTDWEKQSVDSRIEEARALGVKVVPVPSLVRRIAPLHDLRALVGQLRPVVVPVDVVADLHTDRAEVCLEYWRVERAGSHTSLQFPYGRVDLTVFPYVETATVKQDCGVVVATRLLGIGRADYIAVVPPGKRR